MGGFIHRGRAREPAVQGTLGLEICLVSSTETGFKGFGINPEASRIPVRPVSSRLKASDYYLNYDRRKPEALRAKPQAAQ